MVNLNDISNIRVDSTHGYAQNDVIIRVGYRALLTMSEFLAGKKERQSSHRQAGLPAEVVAALSIPLPTT